MHSCPLKRSCLSWLRQSIECSQSMPSIDPTVYIAFLILMLVETSVVRYVITSHDIQNHNQDCQLTSSKIEFHTKYINCTSCTYLTCIYFTNLYCYKINTVPELECRLPRPLQLPPRVLSKVYILLPDLIAKDRTEKQWLIQFVIEKHLCQKSGNVNVWCFS